MFNPLCNDCDNLNNIFLVLSPNDIGNQNYTQQPWRECHSRYRHIYQMTGNSGRETDAMHVGSHLLFQLLHLRRRTVKTYSPQPALGILDIGTGVQIPRVVHKQHRVLFERKRRHVLTHALGSVEQIVELFNRRVGVGVRRGRVVQDVLPEAYLGASRHRVDVEQLTLDRVFALEELWWYLEIELVGAQYVDGLWREKADEVAGPEDAEDTTASFVRVDDVEAEITRRSLLEGGVGVPGEFAQRVRNRDCFLACAFGVHAFGLELDVPECTLGAAVGVWPATHLFDDVKHELAVWIRPSHLDAAYAVFLNGVSVH